MSAPGPGVVATGGPVAAGTGGVPGEQVPLVDLLDRVLARGVVVSGEITLAVADVDLVQISLRALLSSVRPDLFPAAGPDQADGTD